MIGRRSFGGRRGSWPANIIRRAITATGRDQVAAGTVGAIDRAAARGLSGRSGAIRAGTTADPGYRLNGYVDYDTLALTRTVAASSNLVGDPNVALPATSGAQVVVGAGWSVADSLAAVPVMAR